MVIGHGKWLNQVETRGDKDDVILFDVSKRVLAVRESAKDLWERIEKGIKNGLGLSFI